MTGSKLATLLLIVLLFLGCERTPSEQDVGRAMLNDVSYTQSDFLLIYHCAERYRRSEGSYPRSLSDLVKSEHGRVLINNLHGVEKTEDGYVILDRWHLKPLRYICPGRVWSDAFDVYSFGPNGIDDEGKHDDVTSWELIDNREKSGNTTMYSTRHPAEVEVAHRLMRLSKKK